MSGNRKKVIIKGDLINNNRLIVPVFSFLNATVP